MDALHAGVLAGGERCVTSRAVGRLSRVGGRPRTGIGRPVSITQIIGRMVDHDGLTHCGARGGDWLFVLDGLHREGRMNKGYW